MKVSSYPIKNKQHAGSMESCEKRSRARRYATPLSAVLLFSSIKVFGLAVLALWSHTQEKSAVRLLSQRWDSLWYVRVAEHGYDFTLKAQDGRELSSKAFFPLLPWLERGVSAVGLTPSQAGLLVSAVASIFAALGLFHLGRHLHSPQAGTLLVCLWASLPVAIVQSMAYSESLFVALAAWSLYFLLQDRWVVAASLACAAGLTRPVGVALGLAICVHAFTRLRHVDNKGKILASCALSLAGASTYILWVGVQQGNFLGYLDVQEAWGNGFDFGYSFALFIGELASPSPIIASLFLIVLIAITTAPHLLMYIQGYPLPLIVYSAVVASMAMGASGYFGSKPRLLIPAFPLLLLIAVTLSRSAKPYLWIAPLAVTSALYGAFWLNGSGPP
ncbi:glycosyltransferase family 39 protein [Streptomyces sp. NPDC048001]|uniref:glycosyltransferase family 39 protein n=1 Tax=unclassified Streptomyces TaxID=2593676 RepID=UPI0037108561